MQNQTKKRPVINALSIRTFIFLSLFFSTYLFSGCKDECADVFCLNGGTCTNGICLCPTGYSGINCENKTEVTLTFKNNTFTTVFLRVNGINKNILPGYSADIKGKPGENASGTAYTTAGRGETFTWAINSTFPESVNTVAIDVNNDYFFVQIKNTSSETITDLYINENLVSEKHESFSIPSDGVTYNIGYYPAYTNSNAKIESFLYQWTWSNLNLPFNSNQSVLLLVD